MPCPSPAGTISFMAFGSRCMLTVSAYSASPSRLMTSSPGNSIYRSVPRRWVIYFGSSSARPAAYFLTSRAKVSSETRFTM